METVESNKQKQQQLPASAKATKETLNSKQTESTNKTIKSNKPSSTPTAQSQHIKPQQTTAKPAAVSKPQPAKSNKRFNNLVILTDILIDFIFLLDILQDSDAFMEALGNISTTSRSLTKNSGIKPKLVKKEETANNEPSKDTNKISINKNDSLTPSNVSSNIATSDKVNILANINNRVIMINKIIFIFKWQNFLL